MTIRKRNFGVPWWCSGLRIWRCYHCDSGHCRGVGLIPGLGASPYCRHDQKKKVALKFKEYVAYLKGKYSWFTMLYQFLLSQSCIYLHILFLCSMMVHPRRLDLVPCAVYSRTLFIPECAALKQRPASPQESGRASAAGVTGDVLKMGTDDGEAIMCY